LAGIAKTAAVTRALVALTVVALLTVIGAGLTGGKAHTAQLTAGGGVGGLHGSAQAAALLFFAFAGYARIATLGEEVRDPERTIPRAIPVALGLTVVLYAAVGVGALVAAGPEALAASATPIAEAVRVVDAAWAVPV